MGANFGDLDNDGFLDVYLGTGAPSFASLIPNILLRNDAGRRFHDVTEATGTGHLQKGHGVAFADLDEDGDQDIVLNVGGAVPGDRYDDALFGNPGGHGNDWLSIRLVGVKSNRAAIGAQITIRSKARSGAQVRYREVVSGGSFGARASRSTSAWDERRASSRSRSSGRPAGRGRCSTACPWTPASRSGNSPRPTRPGLGFDSRALSRNSAPRGPSYKKGRDAWEAFAGPEAARRCNPLKAQSFGRAKREAPDGTAIALVGRGADRL